METFYLIDFENVHNEGMENISTLTQTDHVHIFYTENASKISMDNVLINGIDIEGHKVPSCKQSLDMHLVSYLGYLLGLQKEKKYSYVIISKDKDYDNIIKFWQDKGFKNISRKHKIPGSVIVSQKKTPAKLSGKDRCKLNIFVQQGLRKSGYKADLANRICSFVVKHCNDEHMLSLIHNDIRKEYKNFSEIYENVKRILENFELSKSEDAKRESQIRSFFGKHLKKKVYTENKEEIIQIILEATSRQQVNNKLMKLYRNGNRVKEAVQTLQPLIKDLPGVCQ